MHRVLEGIIRSKRIASAYLFVGPPGSGKTEAAEAFANCLGGKKFDKIKVKSEGASIKIEQIRELQQLVRYGPSASDYLVAVVEEADKMTDEAVGAFLKTLEEPPSRVVFVLTVEREERLPETIISRCQKVIFGEGQKEWQPRPEFDSFYSDLKGIRKKSILELLEFSARLSRFAGEKEKERIEELLYDLIFYARCELGNLKLVRILLEAVKNLKRKANLKLALEVACLKMPACR